jgi:hypothetical protein
MNGIKSIVVALFLSFTAVCSAQPSFGIKGSEALISKEPSSLHGYGLFLSYDPQSLSWRQFNLYFDAGFSHFWVNHSSHQTINIYSAAPIIHYTFKQRGPLTPYLELSIGLAYLNHTHLEYRNLGMHFAFQDRLGIGALLSEHVSIGLHAIHYSNARLSSHNAGITIPLMLDVGYRF